MRTALGALALTLAAPVAASDLVLGLPVDCSLGSTCHIQQFVDRDPGPGVIDYQCGGLTYDGHKGTDFALPTLMDMQNGVDVIASAPGVVRAIRDGMQDIVFSDSNAASVDGRECGNGVVIEHKDGWETQYCHMKSGSVQVRKGDQVARGDALGQVGLSGRSEFPHLHLAVRKNGEVVDPFNTVTTRSCDASATSLWEDTPPYVPGGVIYAGFSAGVPSYDAVKDGTASKATLAPDAAGLVVFLYAFGGLKGDEIQISITGPEGEILEQATELDKDQAQFFQAAGKRLTSTRWPAGTYEGTVSLTRGDTALDRQTVEISID